MDNINVVVEANNARKGYTQTYETIVLKPNVHDEVNVLTEEMFTKENAKYVIKWNYDLMGESITVPENCIISMEGGSLTNGTLVGQNTKLINESGDESLVSVGLRGSWKRPDAHVTADEEDLTINSHNQIQLANKMYDEEAFSGMGRVYLRKNIVDGKNILDDTMMYEPNTIYVIQYDFDLDGDTLEVPENCVLKFEGGSIGNGTLNVNGSKILPDYNSLQGNNLTLTGMPSVGTLYWQGGKPTWNNGSKWVEFDGAKAGVYRFGTSDKRPQSADIYPGFQYYDTTLGVTITWGGLYWVNENGFHAAVVRGELADRPTSELTAVDEGYQYYATDVHKVIYFSYNNGSPKWYYADGTDVQ